MWDSNYPILRSFHRYEAIDLIKLEMKKNENVQQLQKAIQGNYRIDGRIDPFDLIKMDYVDPCKSSNDCEVRTRFKLPMHFFVQDLSKPNSHHKSAVVVATVEIFSKYRNSIHEEKEFRIIEFGKVEVYNYDAVESTY